MVAKIFSDPKRSPCHLALGMTLVEIVVSAAIVCTFLASLYAMNSQIMLVLRSTRNQLSASRVLEERTEQLRMAGWGSITQPELLRKLVSEQMRPESSGVFSEPDTRETVTVTALNSLDLSERNSNIVVRRQNGTTNVSSSGGLPGECLVRVDVELTWKESGRDVAPRKTSATISAGGLVSASLAKAPYVAVQRNTGGTVLVADPVLSPGITISVMDRPAVQPTPAATPIFCKHGRPWPHCGSAR